MKHPVYDFFIPHRLPKTLFSHLRGLRAPVIKWLIVTLTQASGAHYNLEYHWSPIMLDNNTLDDLKQQTVFILREAKARFKNIGILWSGGKDSTAILALCREAFFNTVPFPVIHIDNGIDFPETYEFLGRLAKTWNLDLLTAKSVIKKDKISGIACCGANKTEALKKLMKKEGFDGLIVSIRSDEHGIRAKERTFSPRDAQWRWNYQNQPA